MHKLISKTVIFLLCAGLLLSFSGCGENAPSPEELSRLVADTVLSENANKYAEGECCAEGHIILGRDLSDEGLKIYALTTSGHYGFQNDLFIKVSGSGVIPAVLTFGKDGEAYRLRKEARSRSFIFDAASGEELTAEKPDA